MVESERGSVDAGLLCRGPLLEVVWILAQDQLHGGTAYLRTNKRWEHFVGRHQSITRRKGRFPVYVETVEERLTRQGFTRYVQLDEDPAWQDKLTTWIEYLRDEYWWYDLCARSKY